MRKFVLCLVMFLVLAGFCSGCANPKLEYTLNPPEWIQGAWESDDEKYVCIFTENNFVFNNGISIFDFNKENKGTNIRKIPQETISDHYYEINNIYTRYKFTKISSELIHLMLKCILDENEVGPISLIRQ